MSHPGSAQPPPVALHHHGPKARRPPPCAGWIHGHVLEPLRDVVLKPPWSPRSQLLNSGVSSGRVPLGLTLLVSGTQPTVSSALFVDRVAGDWFAAGFMTVSATAEPDRGFAPGLMVTSMTAVCAATSTDTSVTENPGVIVKNLVLLWKNEPETVISSGEVPGVITD